MTHTFASPVESAARTALDQCPIYLIRQLHVEMIDNQVLLSGRVDSFYHKQLAQEVVLAVSPDLQVINLIEVDTADSLPDQEPASLY